jgi:hypothetical protein
MRKGNYLHVRDLMHFTEPQTLFSCRGLSPSQIMPMLGVHKLKPGWQKRQIHITMLLSIAVCDVRKRNLQ